MTTATINNRVFQLTENSGELRYLRAEMIRSGFDGTIWEGFSPRTGRQRKDLHCMVWRYAKSGKFVIATAV